MNFEKVRKNKRKAISPVLATVILIAITLIAAIAIAGFVFGLFGSFTSSAQVSGAVLNCYAIKNGGAGTHADNNECTILLTNTGTSNVAVTGGSVQIGGTAVQCNGILTLPTVTASSTAQFTCLQLAMTAGQTIGSQAVGSVTLSNGASVAFSGVWS